MTTTTPEPLDVSQVDGCVCCQRPRPPGAPLAAGVDPAAALASAEQRAAAVAWLMPYVMLLPAAAAQDAMLGRMSERLGVHPDALRADLRARLPRGDGRRVVPEPPALRLLRASATAARLGCPATARACLEDALAEAGEVHRAA
jgi:hypothetical protein